VQGYGWTHAREQVHLARIAEFFFRRGGSGGLNEFSKSCAGVGETPGRQLDAEGLERVKNLLSLCLRPLGPLFGIRRLQS